MPKSLSLSITLVALCTNLNAQITLTASLANPQPGDTAVYYKNIGNPGPAGAGVTWDFSSLDTSSRKVVAYYGCQPNHSVCADSSIGIFVWHYYLNYDMDSLTDMGWDCNCNESFSIINPKQLLHYPLDYNGPHYADSFQFIHTSQGGYYEYGIGAVDISADAYGTLILPDSTYPNTLRVKRREACKYDWTYNNIGPHNIYTSVDEYYEWYSESSHTFLLQLKLHISTTKVDELSDRLHVDIHPNPANDLLNIDLGADNGEIKQVAMDDIIGRTVVNYAGNHLGNKLALDVSDLPPGSYFLRIKTPKGVAIKKVLIAR